MFEFALVRSEGEALGGRLARPDFDEGDIIPHGAGRSVRALKVIAPMRDGLLPVLVVEPV